MYNLSFAFSVEKLVHSIAFFSVSGARDLTKLKVAKLIYFADKAHLLARGQPIIGDVYWCMDWGPVPSFSLNEMNEAISATIGRPEVPLLEGCDVNVFTRVLNIKRGFFSSTHPWFEAKESYDASVFSGSELEVLRDTVRVYGAKTAGQLIDLTHKEPTWEIANQSRLPHSRTPIPYELFFVGAPYESQRLLAKLVADQCGIAIPLVGDAEYMAFANELASHDFAPDDVVDSDIRGHSPYRGA
jgi:uncharacterized phage-associated protein